MKKTSIFIGLMTALCIISCNTKTEEKKEERTFKLTNPVAIDTSIVKEYVCQIHAMRHIELRAIEKGYLQKINVDEGQKVAKGQAMFQIMPNIFQAELLITKAESDLASIEYKNTKLLADGKIVQSGSKELALKIENEGYVTAR